MNNIKEDWEELCYRQFSIPIPDAQKEIMQWAFYHGVANLLMRIHNMHEQRLGREEAADIFNSIQDELLSFFETFDERKH